jgi:hypothetical protein
MEILIYGHDNWIAQEFINVMTIEKIKMNIFKKNFKDASEILKQILEISPTHIVFFSDDTNTNLYEQMKFNLYAPFLFTFITEKLNIHFTCIGPSSIYHLKDVYAKNESNNVIINDFTDKILYVFDHLLQLHLSIPIVNYHHPEHIITQIMHTNIENENEISLCILSDIFPIVLNMMKEKTTGQFHLANPGTISLSEISKLYFQIVERKDEKDTKNKDTKNEKNTKTIINNYNIKKNNIYIISYKVNM